MPTSTPLQPTITTAGLTAIFNAQNTGVEFALTHIAFGTAQYTPDGSETALRAEMVRVPIAGGGRISPTQIQIYAVAMAALGHPFFVGEVGFFGNNGTTLLAVYSSTATPSLFLSDTVSTSVSYALGLAALPANTVTVTIDPSASAALLLIGNHVAAADPHPQYVEKVNGVAFYDPTLTFNQGAEIIGDDLLVYQSAQANNIGHTPSSSPTWWVPLFNYGNTPVTGLAAVDVTLSSTQAARAHITFSGALTASLNIIFPGWVKEWIVLNKTTGAFSLTCKTAAGTGVAIPQNSSPTRIYGDGTNIVQVAENVAPATASPHPLQLGQLGALPNSQYVSTAGKLNGVNNPNLLYNGSAEFGAAGWNLGSTLSAQNDATGGFGTYFANASPLAAVTVFPSAPPFAAGAGDVLTASADVGTLGVTAGTVQITASCYNSSGTFISNVGTLAVPNGTANARYSSTFTTPAGTASVAFEVALTGVTATAFGLTLRRVKVELGTTPSLYSQEASIAALNSGRLLRTSVYYNNAGTLYVSINGGLFTAAGSSIFATLAATQNVDIECQGAGAGTGGCAATSSTAYCATSGAQSGAYSRGMFTAAQVNGALITCGAAGTAAAAGNNNGGAGGSSSVGALITAPGGAATQGTGTFATTNNFAAAPASTTQAIGSGGYINMPCGSGQLSLGLVTAAGASLIVGAGGSSPLGQGGIARNSGGSNGQGFGAGASGSGIGISTSAATGFAGTPGAVIFREYA
jgi:hypothetical protein